MINEKNNLQNHYLSLKENILWLSVVLLTIGSMFLENVFMYVLFFWSFKFVFENNIRRIPGIDDIILTIIRRSMYSIPLVLPLCFNGILKLNYCGEIKITHILIALAASIIIQIPHLNNWRISLSYDFISFQERKKAFFYIMEIYSALTAAIFEEVFFRGFIISVLKQKIGILSVIIASFLFFLHHYECKWASSKFVLIDYINEIIFGVIFGVIYYLTNDIYTCILGHLVFNSLNITLNVRKYLFFYIKKGTSVDQKG